MQENYAAWNIKYKDFSTQKSLFEQIMFLIQFGVLAPSGHNSQPWRFHIDEKSLLIFPELKRALSKSDPNDRQLYISLGCALENILIAADYYQFDTVVDYLPRDRENVAAAVTFNPRTTPENVSENHLIFSIPKRHTNRNKYALRMPDDHFLSWVKSLAYPDFRVDLLEDKEKKEVAADISARALVSTMDDRNFREELSQYLKSNFTKSKVGMPGFSHGIPGPVSLIASSMIRRVNVNRLSIKKDEELLKKFTPLFCLISSNNDDKKSWLEAGRIYQRIALEAERNNLKTSLLAAAMQREDANRELQQFLQLTHRPQIFFRIGYCDTNAFLTPRMSSREVLGS